MLKTEYGVRISDWSSDVCSSDRHASDRARGRRRLLRLRPRPDDGRGRGSIAGARRRQAQDTHRALHGGSPVRRRRGPDARPPGPGAGPDRKSVVEGKSVSVRVDLGGRRILKKKNTYLKQHITTI